METLFIDRRDIRLDVEGQRLLIHHPERRLAQSIPLARLGWVVISRSVQLTSDVLFRLSAAKVSLAVMSGRGEPTYAGCELLRHGNVARRVWQYRMSQSPDVQQRLSSWLVISRMLRQARLLQVQAWQRPQARRILLAASQAIRAQVQALRAEEVTPSVARLRGIEGSAAARYFEGLQAAFAPALNFTGRNRRPPKDPVNVVLSLGYSLLHQLAEQQLVAYGLDPMIGFYHQLEYSRSSLACDLIELYRDQVEAMAIELFATQVLRPEHFTQQADGCLMTKAGRALCYQAFARCKSRWVRSMRNALRRALSDLPDEEARA
ncbi:CRISPR-associated endonuclease Cas1 [Pokkaliibacter plantistimulans]|uniref:CRISPR-associated endonuclease Cas1 n=1 Tax=Pokkaliibacter plantistimulans TaxID=1635171 RepID=UPI0014022191|nr:CRISPR-associated endonuclease Cas1 [Pokkaliibacter plantistimulans]